MIQTSLITRTLPFSRGQHPLEASPVPERAAGIHLPHPGRVTSITSSWPLPSCFPPPNKYRLIRHTSEKTRLSPLTCLCSFVKNQLTRFVWVYFWALHSVPIIYLLLLSLTSEWLDNHGFIVSREVGWQESSDCSSSILCWIFWVSYLPMYI